MVHQNLKTYIQKILDDDTLPRAEKVKLFETKRRDATAEMRAASESAMVDDNECGDDHKLLDQALDDLAGRPDSIKDGGAASL